MFLKVFFASCKHLLFSTHGNNGRIFQKYIDLVTFIKPDEQPVLLLGVSLVVAVPLALLRGSGDGWRMDGGRMDDGRINHN